jgi:hypothetical protein
MDLICEAVFMRSGNADQQFDAPVLRQGLPAEYRRCGGIPCDHARDGGLPAAEKKDIPRGAVFGKGLQLPGKVP